MKKLLATLMIVGYGVAIACTLILLTDFIGADKSRIPGSRSMRDPINSAFREHPKIAVSFLIGGLVVGGLAQVVGKYKSPTIGSRVPSTRCRVP